MSESTSWEEVYRVQTARIAEFEAERDDYKSRWEQTGCTRHSAMEAAIKIAESRSVKIAELESQLSNEECDSAFWMKRAEAAEAETNELKLLLGAAQQYIPQLELEKDAIQGWLNLAHRVADDFEDRANVAEAKLAAVARLELFDLEGNSFDIDELQAALGQG